MLNDYNPNFEYIPIEEEIYLNQNEYYDSISKCHINGNANAFINFMLNMINNLLEKTTQKKLNKIQIKIIDLIKKNPYITSKELANNLNISEDGVKYNLNKLTKNNIIERIGSDKGVYWKNNIKKKYINLPHVFLLFFLLFFFHIQ